MPEGPGPRRAAERIIKNLYRYLALDCQDITIKLIQW